MPFLNKKSEMRQISLFLGALSILFLSACDKNGGASGEKGLDKVTYTVTDELFANPERGMYSGTSFSSESGSPISKNALLAGRAEKRTLYMLEFWLKDFFESDISDAYLELIRKNLEVYRTGGAKCILRFGYSNSIKDLNHPEQSAPFDASEEQVLRHIAQLKPILQEYSDVIFVLQAGFVGCWGEWYYTDHFIQGPTSPEDFLPRKHVCDALLDALPGDRQVELRTPQFKMKMYGYSLADTITRAEAHQPTTKARLAGHNDCYLASSNDQGTFSGPSDKEYWKAETKYTIMGGETCDLSNFCKCDNTLKSMAEQHFTYLNVSYNKEVINYWVKNNCYDEIKLRLGYRLALTEGSFTEKPVAGSPFRIVLKIDNVGFASVMNPRDAELVLTSKDGKVVKTWKVNSDPRFWMPGTTTVIDQTVNLPEGLSGEYSLSLNLPDPAETLRNNPMFSIRLANKNVWDESTGYNKLYTISL